MANILRTLPHCQKLDLSRLSLVQAYLTRKNLSNVEESINRRVRTFSHVHSRVESTTTVNDSRLYHYFWHMHGLSSLRLLQFARSMRRLKRTARYSTSVELLECIMLKRTFLSLASLGWLRVGSIALCPCQVCQHGDWKASEKDLTIIDDHAISMIRWWSDEQIEISSVSPSLVDIPRFVHAWPLGWAFWAIQFTSFPTSDRDSYTTGRRWLISFMPACARRRYRLSKSTVSPKPAQCDCTIVYIQSRLLLQPYSHDVLLWYIGVLPNQSWTNQLERWADFDFSDMYRTLLEQASWRNLLYVRLSQASSVLDQDGPQA